MRCQGLGSTELVPKGSQPPTDKAQLSPTKIQTKLLLSPHAWPLFYGSEYVVLCPPLRLGSVDGKTDRPGEVLTL